MLPKTNRIKKKKDFEIIFKKAQSFRNSLFILKVIENSLGINRVGFVVSSKVSKKAVVRNKVRRRLAQIMKTKINDIKAGVDLVFIALAGIEKKDFSEVKDAVNSILIKTKLTDRD
jgi:ribonuclease P protein component